MRVPRWDTEHMMAGNRKTRIKCLSRMLGRVSVPALTPDIATAWLTIFFILKENRRKLPGHKIASSTHKIAPAAHKIPAPPWMSQKWLEDMMGNYRPHILCTAGAILRASDFRHGQTQTPKDDGP
jgi:hypothetical protein